MITFIILCLSLIGLADYYFDKYRKKTILEKGVIISQRFEATQDRYYFLIEVGWDKLTDVMEYTCSEGEWKSYHLDQWVSCELVTDTNDNYIIKSISEFK